MSKDDTRIGSLKQVVELRARIAELERENDALSMEASENLQRREKAESDFKELSISSNARVAEGLLARSAVALAAERERREDIRANGRRALREKLICAALTGLMGQTSASERWYAELAISQADAVLDAIDKVDELQPLAATLEKRERG